MATQEFSSVTGGPAPLAKLASPRLGRVFPRERVFAALDALAAAPGVWLAAAPGAGKSTAIATWLHARSRCTLWLQIDPGDADPATFAQSFDGLFAGTTGQGPRWPAFGADDAADLSGWLRRRVRAQLLALPPPWTLVLDNVHDLPADAALQSALAQVLTELPVGVQWVFVSRETPPPAFAAALARQQLALVDASLLRFDHAETLALTRLHSRPDAMAEAMAAANGWAGGLTLMLLGSPSGAVAPVPSARERLFDYFAEEVLAQLDPDEQHTLGQLALLPGADAALATQLTGRNDAGDLLERLAAQSLFTDRRNTEEAVVYVFHALFAEFLGRRLERVLSPAALGELQRRAGLLLVAHGQPDAGLQRLADAGAWDDAAAVLARLAPAYIGTGRTAALRAHLERLPLPQQRPFTYWLALCLLDADPAAALAALDLAQDEAGKDEDAALAIAAARAAALLALGRPAALDGCLRVLDAHLDRAAQIAALADAPAVQGSAAGEFDLAMRVVPGLLAAVITRAPWHPLAEPLAARAERLLHNASAPGQRLLLGTLALHLLWRGHLERLERIVMHVDALCAHEAAAPRSLLRWWSVGVLVKTLLGQSDSARIDAARALALVERDATLAPQRAGAELQAMLAALSQRDAPAARRHLEAASRALHPDQSVERSTLEHQRGILALLEQDGPTALRLMREAVASSRGGGSALREHIVLIAHALAAACAGAEDEAQVALRAVFAHPFHAACRWHHWVAGSVAAYAALRRGDRDDALVHLQGAMSAAAEHGFRHAPMLFVCGDMMARLMALALTHGIEPEVARDVVRRNALTAPPEADVKWPWRLRVQALGGWRVQLDGAPLPTGRKPSRRLLELLKLIVAQGDAPLSQEEAADLLWPDADGDAARNALDNALHRLRRMLGDESLLVVRDGALSLDPGRCWSDVVGLERQLARLAQAVPAALATEAQAVSDACAGVLLPTDDIPGVAPRRARLQQRVVRALRDASARLVSQGRTSEAAAAEAGARAAEAGLGPLRSTQSLPDS